MSVLAGTNVASTGKITDVIGVDKEVPVSLKSQGIEKDEYTLHTSSHDFTSGIYIAQLYVNDSNKAALIIIY